MMPSILNSGAAQNGTGGDSVVGSSILKVDEHRISLFQEGAGNTLSVQDEFWISNAGNEPFYGYAYNRLPDDIYASDNGMFCQVSETGGHSCFSWLHENNNYYWDGNYVLLPENYADDFEFAINITSINNRSITHNITKEINSTNEDLVNLIESDTWGWVRDGFEHGWTLIFNFTINNTNNETDIFDLDHIKIPAGLRFSLYYEKNNNGSLDINDPVIGFDGNYDGRWEAAGDYDSNDNNIPDISIDGNESMTFYVYVRADYRLHFLTAYKKDYNPSGAGIIQYNKDTLYDTELMRVFVVPKSDGMVESDSLFLQERSSETDFFYYGEWSGNKNQEIRIKLEGEVPDSVSKSGSSVDRESGLIIALVLVSLVILVAIMVRARRQKKYTMIMSHTGNFKIRKDMTGRKDQIRGRKRIKSVKKRQSKPEFDDMDYNELMKERAQFKKIIKRFKTKEYTDEVEKEIESKICREFEVKLKTVEKAITRIEAQQLLETDEEAKQRYIKAIMRLEEDYEEGRIDKDIYNELKNNYTKSFNMAGNTPNHK
jgi:hypothetical protein